MGFFKRVWTSYTLEQKRNIAIYIMGIMFYKLGLEFFNGSITTLATDRFNSENALTKLGAAQGLNQAMQCVGAILIAPLVKMFPTRTVLASAVFMFALMTSILLIVDAATGGHIRKPGGKVTYGDWNPNAIFPIWGIAGIAYGMVELIRRVIPADIVGGDVNRLRRMDATVHILYEVAGTAGAFASSAAITRFGNNYSFLLTPIFFALAGTSWLFISALSFKAPAKNMDGDAALSAVENEPAKHRNYFVAVYYGFIGFFKSVYYGGKLIFLNRSMIWLFPAYSLALYLHRFLESSLAPAYAKRILGTSAWSQIIVGGSNFGELCGASAVFFLSDIVVTPIPWLRLDAVALNIVWVLVPFSKIAKKNVNWAWYTAACFLPISFGWAAGDVSLAAYIQSRVSSMDIGDSGISPLGAVMSFLYSAYIVFNAVLSSTLGKVMDNDWTAHKSLTHSFIRVAGVQFSVCCAIIFAATFIPKGSFAFNPKLIEGQQPGEQDQLDGGLLKEGGSPARKDSDIDEEKLKVDL